MNAAVQQCETSAARPAPVMQRSAGAAFLGLAARGGRAAITGLGQRGSAKVILPNTGAVPEAVFLNTSGGLTSGDRLTYGLELGAGLRGVATTQTAERAYLAPAGLAEVSVDLSVGAGGWLDWLPQETILFQGAGLNRRTVIRLGAEAGCMALEAVVLGRAAMGERVTRLRFFDRREIWRAGRVLHLEPLALDDAALGAGDVVLGRARAFASLVCLGAGVADALPALRRVLDEPGVDASASAYDGRLVLRMRAGDGWPMRRQICRALSVLRHAPLPRVWQDLERAG